jgi:hypothetical protein
VRRQAGPISLQFKIFRDFCQPERERERDLMVIPFALWVLFSYFFFCGRERPSIFKRISGEINKQKKNPFFFPQKNRGLSFSTLLAPQRTDPENLINRIKK